MSSNSQYILLSAVAATLSDNNKTYILIGLVFATTVGIILYQIHLCYFAKSALWLKIMSKMSCFQEKKKSNVLAPLDKQVQNTPEPIISKTVIDLREPLLESS